MIDFFTQQMLVKIVELLSEIKNLLENNQPAPVDQRSSQAFEEQVQEIAGCRWCGYGEGHHRECPRYNRT